MGRKLLLEHDGVPGIHTFEVYRSKGGYASVEKALKTMTPDAVTEQVKISGLRGRGGAGVAVRIELRVPGRKADKARYPVLNTGETEPGTIKDREPMCRDSPVVR